MMLIGNHWQSLVYASGSLTDSAAYWFWWIVNTPWWS